MSRQSSTESFGLQSFLAVVPQTPGEACQIQLVDWVGEGSCPEIILCLAI